MIVALPGLFSYFFLNDRFLKDLSAANIITSVSLLTNDWTSTLLDSSSFSKLEILSFTSEV